MPLDKRLGLAIAVVSGVLVPTLLAVSASRQAPDNAQGLDDSAPQVVNVAVSEDALVPFYDGDVLTGEVSTSRIDVSMRNIGDVVSVLHKLEAKVLDYQRIDYCFVHGGPSPVSADYDLVLPLQDPEGQVAEVEVRQEIPAGAADRFQLVVWMDDDTSFDMHLFRLELHIAYDVAVEPLSLGQVVLVIPAEQESRYFELSDDPDFTSPQCVRENRASLTEFAKLSGERAPEFETRVSTFGR